MAEVKIVVDNSGVVLAELETKIELALMKCGATVENYAKQDVPVDTGRLRNSIKHQMEGNDTVAIGTDVEYGKYVELGTSRMRAREYLKPAVANHIKEYENIIKSTLEG